MVVGHWPAGTPRCELCLTSRFEGGAGGGLVPWALIAGLGTRDQIGFGGEHSNRYQLEPADSVGVFLHDHMVVGAEYRAKPDNLPVFREEDYWDGFVAWIPCKSASLTMAYADLGNIADKTDQRGWYGSLQLSF